MWKLYYEDTFGFGEDRDPPIVECSGDDLQEGFFRLWSCVLHESVVVSNGRLATGFASFTLVVEFAQEESRHISIDVGKHMEGLGELKKEEDQNTIKDTSTAHCKAVLNNEEDLFWNGFDRSKKVFKVFSVNFTGELYRKRMALYISAILFANLICLFCLGSAVYLFSEGKGLQSFWAGLFAVVASMVNFSFSGIKELRLRYRHPEKFYIEIDEKSFIHSNGDFIKTIPVNSIDTVKEEEIISRGGVHGVFIVNYIEGAKRKEYSFYKATSRRNIVYDINAEAMNDYIKGL